MEIIMSLTLGGFNHGLNLCAAPFGINHILTRNQSYIETQLMIVYLVIF